MESIFFIYNIMSTQNTGGPSLMYDDPPEGYATINIKEVICSLSASARSAHWHR